ncbi:MAG TPA: hypothetical protein VFT98_03765 [Myxococcota bacterium]|nr:hypothetical protein [Myxococcota bacterium]
MRHIIPIAFAAALAAGMFAAPAFADDPALVRLLAESANTPQEHAALADYYDGQAAAARKQANHHRTMGRAYAGGKHFDVVKMKEHCEKLAALYESQATEFAELARVQREASK